MQDRSEAVQDGCKTGLMKNRTDAGQVRCRTEQMRDRSDAGQDKIKYCRCRTGQMQGRTGQMQDRKNAVRYRSGQVIFRFNRKAKRIFSLTIAFRRSLNSQHVVARRKVKNWSRAHTAHGFELETTNIFWKIRRIEYHVLVHVVLCRNV